MAKNKDNGALATLEQPATYAIMNRPVDELREIMQANLGVNGTMNAATDLERIKVPAQGITLWTVNTLDGEEQVKELEGIILHWREPRVYYERGIEEGGGNQPPDCYSDDGLIGVGTPGGACGKCPFAAWGSAAKGKGQACKQKRLLFFLRPGNLLPDALFLPPTSIKPVKQFFLRLSSQAVPFYGIKTRLTLEKANNAAGIAFSRVVPSLAGRLTAEELMAVRGYIETIRPALEKVRATAEDVADKGDAFEG